MNFKSASLIIALLLASSEPSFAQASSSPELDLQSKVYDDAMACIKDGGDQANCFVEASPARCATQAAGFISDRGLWQRNWVVCVRSCARASLFARTIGDCRR